MINYSGPGDIVECVAPSGGVVSGNAYLIGTMLVVATHDAAQAELFQARPAGIFTLPRTTGGSTGWSAGALVYWDSSAEKLVKAKSSTARRVGWAVTAAGDSDATAVVRLTGAPSAVNVD